MRTMRTLLLAIVPAVMLGACTASLSDADRAELTSASQNAQEAKNLAQQALTAAQSAQASASAAQKSAQEANEKADRMFQRSLRKVAPAH
jgi:hypothetical protein